ncbi:unnamed protein product [Fraxinus pennsylvanica]|uniref:ABC transmembrane type-1 domain-containing protein n=1 Tax=Fraxinus pennsylvanica TaxID=56036 RepID=A0AAD1YVL4_9LAMI|nr:unnamed protein product [Fraxinus pennsylvanica]
MSSFIFCLVFAFLLSWRLTLAAIPFTIMFIVPGLGFGKMMMDVAMKMIESYVVAGGIAEHAISSFRTVYSYVLQKPYGVGNKARFCKSLDDGEHGISSLGWISSG